jgi:Ferric reductase like transmembrane component/FAD-binding domain
MEPHQLPPGLSWALGLSPKASADDLSTWTKDDVFDPRSPALRALVEQVLFTRKFVPTYYAVLGAFVGICALKHRWTSRARQSQGGHSRASPCHTPTSTSNASSDSTLLASETNSVKDLDTEQTFLLPKQEILGKVRNDGSSVWRYMRSWLMFQPEPVVAITSPTNSVPRNYTSLIVLLLISLNVFYLFYHVPLTIPMLFAFADRAGLCFAVNLPVLYVLSAKTNQPLQALTSWSYEGLNLFHRRLGEWMIALAALHGALMMGVWYTLLRPLHFTLMRFLSSKVILLGILALISYTAIYVTSIGWVRRLWYETFLGLHVLFQVLALSLLFFHHPNSRPYVLVSLVIWCLDRVVCRMLVSSKRLVATLQQASDQKTTLIFCDIPLSPSRFGVRTSICKGWKPGQHVFISVPSLGWRHKLQAHPFTIASPAPPSQMKKGSWPLQLIIRSQDGFSKELLEYARFHQHCDVHLDGPYGSSDALEAVESADRVCFVAGGSGIAVTYPLSWASQVADHAGGMASARTLYDNGFRRGPHDLTYCKLDDSERFEHLWIRQDVSSDSWISYFPRLQAMRLRRETLEGQEVVHLITSKFETDGIHSLRPDVGAELHNWATAGTFKRQSLVVVVSGPEGLVRDVQNAAARLVRGGYNVDVHVEKFGW